MKKEQKMKKSPVLMLERHPDDLLQVRIAYQDETLMPRGTFRLELPIGGRTWIISSVSRFALDLGGHQLYLRGCAPENDGNYIHFSQDDLRILDTIVAAVNAHFGAPGAVTRKAIVPTYVDKLLDLSRSELAVLKTRLDAAENTVHDGTTQVAALKRDIRAIEQFLQHNTPGKHRK